jgi:hypothetical protein
MTTRKLIVLLAGSIVVMGGCGGDNVQNGGTGGAGGGGKGGTSGTGGKTGSGGNAGAGGTAGSGGKSGSGGKTTSTGGSSAGQPDAAVYAPGSTCLKTSENGLIADFAKDNGLNPADGRQGGFYVYGDNGGKFDPPFVVCEPYPIDPEVGNPTCSGPGSFHVKATGFNTWGAALGVDFAPALGAGNGAGGVTASGGSTGAGGSGAGGVSGSAGSTGGPGGRIGRDGSVASGGSSGTGANTAGASGSSGNARDASASGGAPVDGGTAQGGAGGSSAVCVQLTDAAPPKKGYYDASKFLGVSFWAKSSAPLTKVQVSFPDIYTDGGADPSPVDPNASACGYVPGSTINCSPYLVKFGDSTFPAYAGYQIDTTWKRFDVYFADTKQDQYNIGIQGPGDALSVKYLTAMAVQVNAIYVNGSPTANDFEIWVDDFNFISATGGTSGAGGAGGSGPAAGGMTGAGGAGDMGGAKAEGGAGQTGNAAGAGAGGSSGSGGQGKGGASGPGGAGGSNT